MTAPSTLAALDRATAFVAATGVEPNNIMVHDGNFSASYDCDTERGAEVLMANLAPHITDSFVLRHEYTEGDWELILAARSSMTRDSVNVYVRRPVEAVAR